ncbi:MAG: zinc-ribbon domain-containing protein [Chloroflexota bacterium]
MITFLAAIMVLAAIGIVSWPLLRGTGAKNGPGLFEDTEVSELLAQKDTTLFAISELESDYEIGSLSQSDYRELRKKYEEKAVALIKTVDELKRARGFQGINHIDEEIEVRVLGLRGAKKGTPEGKYCPGCGAQFEADDQFCSRCGAALNAKCPGCSAQVSAEDRFCFRCGAALSTAGKRGRVT